jgi:hypothetical protein
MKLFNIERNSTFYTDPKIKKLRIISDISFVVGVLIVVAMFIFWKDEFSEIEVEGVETFLKMPFIGFIIAVLFFIIGSVFHYIAVGKSIIKEIKSNDNPFLNETLNNSKELDNTDSNKE